MQAEEERTNREKQLEQEERIAKELARISFEKQRDEKMRQYIKENRYRHLFDELDLLYDLNAALLLLCSSSLFNNTLYCIIIIIIIFSMELRELESKLKSAYLNKERAAQIAEQEAMRFETLVSAVLFDFL